MHTDFILSQTDRRPLYFQIMEQIKQKIAVGDWRQGDAIPSIRQMAADLQVSVITVKRAYLELEREGVIVTQHGKGSSVARDADLGARLHEEELDALLDQVARLAAVLGIEPAALQKRLTAAIGRAAAPERVTEEESI